MSGDDCARCCEHIVDCRCNMDENKEPHPWDEFLKWRFKAMIWVKNEFGYSNKKIAEVFSMDEMQVYLILDSHDHPLHKE